MVKISKVIIPCGDRLRVWREGKDMSQLALAIKLGTTPGAVGRWESGSAPPSLAYAVRIERETGIPAAAWVADA